jgi:putative toxin-antitoxin system antitoxin component (TIGR02293 family)
MTEIQDVARLLGVARPRRSVDLVAAIEHGLPLASLARVSTALAPADGGFKYRIVPKASLARRKRGDRLSPSESARVARLAAVWAHAVRVWHSAEDAREFLGRPHQLLGGERPLELATASELGARLVEELLGRIQASVAV